jgi:hypothetical protein
VIPEDEIETLWDNDRSAVFERPEICADEPLIGDHTVANHDTLPKSHGVSGLSDDTLNQGLAGIAGMEQHHNVPDFRIVNLIREFVDDQAVLIMKGRLHAPPFNPSDLEPKRHDEGCVDSCRSERAEPENSLSADRT